jgi:hypothetical protein
MSILSYAIKLFHKQQLAIGTKIAKYCSLLLYEKS